MMTTRTLRTTLVAAAFVAALASQTSYANAALAGLQDDRIAVVPLDQIEQRADLLRTSGTRVAPVDVFWSEVAPTRPAAPADPTDPAYRFDRWDRIARALVARGIRPVFKVYSTPAWAAGGRGAPPDRLVNPNAPNAAAFGSFMQAVARRYSGGFGDASGSPIPAVRHLELWNEPNLRGFLAAGERVARPRAYVRMVRAGYAGAHRGNRRAVVIVGALGPRSSTERSGIAALAYQRALLAAKVPMDAFSQHVYPAAAPRAATQAIPAWATVPQLIRELRRARPRVPYLITEAGYTTALTPFRRGKVSVPQQARYLREIFALPVVRRQVALVVWFQLEDNPDWPGGLLRAGGSRKPSWSAFQAVARRGGIPAIMRR